MKTKRLGNSISFVCCWVWGEIFSSRLKSFNSCVPRFSFFFFKSRFFTSLLLRFSGEVDVLSQVVWAVKCNLLSVASSNMYSTHNISPLSLFRLLSALLLPLFSATQWNLRLNFHSNEITINYIGCPTKWGVRRVLASLYKRPKMYWLLLPKNNTLLAAAAAAAKLQTFADAAGLFISPFPNDPRSKAKC